MVIPNINQLKGMTNVMIREEQREVMKQSLVLFSKNSSCILVSNYRLYARNSVHIPGVFLLEKELKDCGYKVTEMTFNGRKAYEVRWKKKKKKK